jgi:hypothetical protein
MQEATTPTPQSFGSNTDVIGDIRQTAQEMAGWLKFVGIINIIGGAISAITIIGIIIAWIPIWMGVLLFQSGSNATNAQAGQRTEELVNMIKKLKAYFIINGILIIVWVAIIVFGFIFMMMGLLPFLNEFRDF